jgi:hypothetical protein
VDRLEALDLLADGQGVGHVGDVAAPTGPHPRCVAHRHLLQATGTRRTA